MNLGGLDLNLLVALDALLSERSVTRAAQRVGLSQPGMSNALAPAAPAPQRSAARPPGRDARAHRASGGADRPGARGARAHPRRARRAAALRPRDRPPFVPPELFGLQRADAHRPARARARGRRARRRRRGPAAARGRPPGAAQRRRRPGHRAAGDHGRRRPGVAAPVGRPLGVLRLGGQHARGQAHDPRALHRARPPHLLDGRRRPARRAARPPPRRASASRGASRSASRASCSRRSCCRARTWSRSSPSEPRRSFAASATSACSSPRSSCPGSSRRSGGTRARPPTRPTHGCVRGSARSRTR